MLHYDVMSWWQLKIQVRFQRLACITMQYSIKSNKGAVFGNSCTPVLSLFFDTDSLGKSLVHVSVLPIIFQ